MLEFETADGSWKPIGKSATDADGRVKDLLPLLLSPFGYSTYRGS